MKRLLYTFFLLLLLSHSAIAETPPVPIGEILVQLYPTTTAEEFSRYLATQSAPLAHLEYQKTLVKKLNLHLFSIPAGLAKAEGVVEKLRQLSSVKDAFLNEAVEFRRTPNDPSFDQQWDMDVIQVEKVWDVTTGGVTALGDTIVVAVIDQGFESQHLDLIPNLWRNRGEIPGDGIDNDGNGYIDDLYGWNFIADSKDFSPHYHGMGVAGIIGAHGNNNIGVTGINWAIKMMLLQFDTVSDIFEAYNYVLHQRNLYNDTNGKQGAFIVATNASWGLVQPTFCSSAWNDMYELLGESGILTAAATTNSGLDIDEVGDTPSGCGSDFIISVTETTQEDRWKGNRGYGKIGVDLGAPGDNSYTLDINGSYGGFNSNSAATPHVTGAIALLYSLPCKDLARAAIEKPMETALVMRNAILNGVDPMQSLKDVTVTGGRLNVFNSMIEISTFCDVRTGPLDLLKLYPNPVHTILTYTYETPDFQDYEIRVFNVLGQLVYTETFEPQRFGEKQKELDVATWPSGMYVLTIFQGKDVASKPFLVH